MTLDKKLNDAFEEMMKYRQSIGYATATYRSSVPSRPAEPGGKKSSRPAL